MSITFHIPGGLRVFTAGKDKVELELAPSATLRDALDALWAMYPAIRDRVLTDQGDVRDHVNLFVGNENSRYTGGLATKLPASAEITIVPAISGGADLLGEERCRGLARGGGPRPRHCQ